MRADVAVEVADDEVELRGGEAEPGHRVRIRDTACMAGGDDACSRRADLAAAIERSADARTARTLRRRGWSRRTRRSPTSSSSDAARARRRSSRSRARRARSSSAVVADATLLDPLRDADGFARERTRRRLPRRRWRARSATRRRRRSGGGSGASCCASRRATCSASPTCPTVGRELAALAAGVPRGARSRIVEPDVPLAVDRHGQARRPRAQLRERRRRAVRARRRRRRAPSAPRARVLATMIDADARTASSSAPTPTSGPRAGQGPLTRTLDELRGVLRASGRGRGSSRRCIKARPVAGDAELGDAVHGADDARSCGPSVLDPDAIREIRAMKERAEETHRAQGPRRPRAQARARRDPRHRVRGAAAPARARSRTTESVRSPNTLDALRAARRRRLRRPTPTPTASTRAYRFLRTVEHRLQLCDEQQTHTLPSDDARAHPARAGARLPRQPGAHRARARSRPSTARTRRAVRSHPRAPLLRAAARDARRRPGPLSPEAAEERLAAFGFTDVERTRAAVRELAAGLTRRSRLMQQLLPVILEWLSETPDPDLGLLQLRRLAEGPARSASLAATFRDAPGAAERTCHLLGSSRVRRRRAAPPARVRRRPRRRRRRSRARRTARRARRRRVRHARVARRRRSSAARGCAASSAASCCASRRRDLLGFAPLEATERELDRARRGVPRSRAGVARARRCRSR